MCELHYFPGNASFTPHVLLGEIGAPFELRLVDRAANAHKAPEYLKLNPAGRIPTLVAGDLVLFESAAICLHLCDSHPGAFLAPPLGTGDRAHFYKWLMFLTNTIQSELLMYHYSECYTKDADGIGAIKVAMDQRLTGWFRLVADNMGDGPYLLGNQFSAVDVYLTMVARWGRFLSKKPGSLPKLGRLFDLVLERPSVQTAIEREGIEGPFLG